MQEGEENKAVVVCEGGRLGERTCRRGRRRGGSDGYMRAHVCMCLSLCACWARGRSGGEGEEGGKEVMGEDHPLFDVFPDLGDDIDVRIVEKPSVKAIFE